MKKQDGLPSTVRLTGRGRGSELAVREAHLTVVDGLAMGARVPCGMQRVRIGSAPENELVLPDPGVSRYHAVLEPSCERLVIRDLESKNGTCVGDTRIKEAYVHPGSVLRFGGTSVRLALENRNADVPASETDRFGQLTGNSVKMRMLFTLLSWVSPTTITLLVTGPTGTGKEVVARSVHESSGRPGELVVLDCGAADAGLISAELFGHEPGAYTGAVGRRAGVFERAHQGTVFIDELGELPLDLQPKLLRVLESRQVRRLGGAAEVPLDVRVVAATNRNLEEMVAAGRFREDLYYRLCQVKVSIPPLSERREDIPALIAHFLAELEPRSPARALAPDALAFLAASSFPGNARQLRNIVERAALVARASTIEMSHLMLSPDELKQLSTGETRVQRPPAREAPAVEVPDECERLRAALETHDYNLSRTARSLGMALNTLKSRLTRFGLPRRRPD